METKEISVSYDSSVLYFLPETMKVEFCKNFRSRMEIASRLCIAEDYECISIKPDKSVRFYFENEEKDQEVLPLDLIDVVVFLVYPHFEAVIRFYDTNGDYAEFEPIIIC